MGWGLNDWGQATPPDAALQNIVAIDAHSNVSMALTSDGEMICWGLYWNCPTPDQLNNVPVVQIAVQHGLAGLAVLANGTTISW